LTPKPLPISIVVPHVKRRAKFFASKCLPQIKKNNPAQIIVEDWEGGACQKRNVGAAKATQPYLLFVDDDSILHDQALSSMLEVLEKDAGAAFAYSDAVHVHYPGVECPTPPGIRRGHPWDPNTLKNGNYVETMSLMRRNLFPGFDSSIARFQDWDLWLTMAEKGYRGVYIPKVLFELHHIDKGISASVPFEGAYRAIRSKHGIQ
jgi:glycosyltransferase involved in cell wall biosynthesis